MDVRGQHAPAPQAVAADGPHLAVRGLGGGPPVQDPALRGSPGHHLVRKVSPHHLSSFFFKKNKKIILFIIPFRVEKN